MQEKSTPRTDARASSPEEAWRRFNDASKAFALLSDRGCPEKLERAGRAMDYWASFLAPAGSISEPRP